MKRRDRTIISKSVFTSQNPKAKNMLLLVQNLQSLGAAGGRQAGDDAHDAGATDLAVAAHGAAADEVLVGLGVVEAADDGPDDVDGGTDALNNEGAALVVLDGVGVVTEEEIAKER